MSPETANEEVGRNGDIFPTRTNHESLIVHASSLPINISIYYSGLAAFRAVRLGLTVVHSFA
jgi:hypothetical protein